MYNQLLQSYVKVFVIITYNSFSKIMYANLVYTAVSVQLKLSWITYRKKINNWISLIFFLFYYDVHNKQSAMNK